MPTAIVAKMETAAENYWGASELEHIWDELQKRSATSANIAQLIFQANITTLKMGNLGEHVAFGDENMRNALMQALANYRMLIYGIAVVLIIMFRPNGLYGYKEFSLKRLIAKLKGKGKTEIGKEAA